MKGNFTITPHSSVDSKGRANFKAPHSQAHVAQPAAQWDISVKAGSLLDGCKTFTQGR